METNILGGSTMKNDAADGLKDVRIQGRMKTAQRVGLSWIKSSTHEQPYWNPYQAGVGIGVVLLAAFVLMGRGLGASGAFTSLVAAGVDTIAPQHVHSNTFYENYLGSGNSSPLKDWLVFEILGVIIGGYVSGSMAGRRRAFVEKGPSMTSRGRMAYALLGGLIMGFGSKLARGCTSGQGLTGGAVLSVGSWVFMVTVFSGAYATAYFVRRQWL